MSAMTTNTSSEDTLIRDSQISGFSAFKERIGFCCCRLFKKSSKYDLSANSKGNDELQEKPSYINQAVQGEKQARKAKLEKIARSLPNASPSRTQTTQSNIPVTQTPTRSLTKVTQETPRSGITLTQTRPQTNTPMSKTGVSTITRPSPLSTNIKTNKQDADETSMYFFNKAYFIVFKKNCLISADSSEEEATSDEEDQSSDSDSAPAKRVPVKATNNRR